MNCTSHERHLGRRITLMTVDGQVTQIDHHERLGGGMMKSVRARPASRDEIRLRFEDGSEASLETLGRGFKATPGQRITAVRASGTRSDSSVLYCYNHDTRKGWFNKPGFANVRRRAPYRMVIWMLPLLALLGAWMSPQQTRGNLVNWVEQISSENSPAAGGEQQATSGPRLFGQARTGQDFAPSMLTLAGEPLTVDSVRRSLTKFVLTGWRDRDWMTFAIVALLLIPVCVMVGNVLIAWPASRSLKRRTKRLAQQHCQAMKAA